MSAAEFFFDYSCPWSYLAFIRLREAAQRTGSTILWRPILLDDLFQQINPGMRVNRMDSDPRRAAYQIKDIGDWARFCNVTIRLPDDFPVHAAPAACGAIIAERQRRIAAYSDRIFSAYFADGLDIGRLEPVVRIAEEAGLDTVAFRAQVEDPEILAQIRANSEMLINKGGFGTPTLFVGDDLYFGNDRMPLVEFALGQSSGRTFVMPGQHG